MPDISVVEHRQPYPKQRNCTSRVFVICSLDACFQIQYLQKFLGISIHLAQKSLNIPQCSCALAFKCRLKKEFQSAEKYITGSGFDLNEFWMHIHLGGWASCHSLSHLLLWRVKMTMKLSFECCWSDFFMKSCGSCFSFPPIDIHGCDSQPPMCRFWEGWSNVISSGWTVLLYSVVLLPSSCHCMRRKTNNQKILHCCAVTGLLAAIPANSVVFTNFISPFIYSHSGLLAESYSFYLFVESVQWFLSRGFGQSSCVELQTNWRNSSGHMSVSLQIKSHLLWSFHTFYLVTCKKRSQVLYEKEMK